MARKKIIAGNWKMNMTPSEAVKLVETLKPLVQNDEVDVVFGVPAICTSKKKVHTQVKSLRLCS